MFVNKGVSDEFVSGVWGELFDTHDPISPKMFFIWKHRQESESDVVTFLLLMLLCFNIHKNTFW